MMCVLCQRVNVAADWIVMPFSRSSSMLSILAPTPSLPRTCGHSNVDNVEDVSWQRCQSAFQADCFAEACLRSKMACAWALIDAGVHAILVGTQVLTMLRSPVGGEASVHVVAAGAATTAVWWLLSRHRWHACRRGALWHTGSPGHATATHSPKQILTRTTASAHKLSNSAMNRVRKAQATQARQQRGTR